jgi:hypothetical protein
MPISVELRENDRILHYRIADPITVDEIRIVMNQGIAIRNNHNHTIHILCDISGVIRVPYKLMSLEKGSELRHPTVGYMAVVTRSRLIRSVTEILIRFVGYNRFRFFTKHEDALAFLQQKIADDSST